MELELDLDLDLDFVIYARIVSKQPMQISIKGKLHTGFCILIKQREHAREPLCSKTAVVAGCSSRKIYYSLAVRKPESSFKLFSRDDIFSLKYHSYILQRPDSVGDSKI